jgi:putative ABC transport system ATP-binding protein
MDLRLVLDALVAGLPYAFCFLGIWLVFRLLDDFDLTVNGSFTLGAAVTAALLTRAGWAPMPVTLVAAASGAVAGVCTALIHLKLKVILLLAGIITMIGLYSVNLRIMVLPNVSFLSHKTLFSGLVTGGPIESDLKSLALIGALLLVIGIALALFLKTDFGLGMRAAGSNPQMAKTVGINTSLAVLIFVVLGNILVAFSGSIVAQQQSFADVGMGNQVILIAITSIMLGEVIVWRTGNIWLAVLGVIVGTAVYQIAGAVAVRAGLQPFDLSLFTSVLLLAIIGFSLFMGRADRWLRIKRREGRSPLAPSVVAPPPSRNGTPVDQEIVRQPRAGRLRGANVRSDGAAVELADIRVTYNRGMPNEVQALRGVDLAIPAGQFLTVIGSNGAGKSTLVGVTAGAVTPTSGVVRIDGRNATGDAEHRRARCVARVFQDPLAGTCPDFTVAENLALASRRGQRRGLAAAVTRARRKEFASYLGAFGLGFEDRLGAKVGGLSGGQRQALSLLMAVAQAPEVLLLDEHTAALDPKNQALVLDMTDQLIRETGCTALMVTHNMEQAIRYGDRMIMMHRGRVLMDVDGAQKAELTVQRLIDLFHRAGDVSMTDEMLLA